MKSDANSIYLLLSPFAEITPSIGSKKKPYVRIIVYLLPLVTVPVPVHAQAQVIVPASDGTNTIVIPQGNRIDITGGQLSRDGSNLFHSLDKFGLDRHQIANFLSQPNIRNILTRVIGGEASSIDGLIKVTGGNSHLFLMNPAGILFSNNARLDVPASFLATAATGISFPSGWFSAVGSNDYRALAGKPNGFAFTAERPGIVMNAGQLEVAAQETLMLVGGTTINTGTLKAPGGRINVVAVPGENLVRISQDGHLLSLEIRSLPEIGTSSALPQTLPIASLPELISGGSLTHATEVTRNERGQIVLASSGKTAKATAIISGSIDTSVGNISSESTSRTSIGGGGGNVGIWGDRVELVGARIDASGATGGGKVEIGTTVSTSHYLLDAAGNPIPPSPAAINAWQDSRINVDRDSVISANAGTIGNGGNVLISGAETIHFSGAIAARGGSSSGDGGIVELSGAGTFAGTVDLSADNGSQGTLRLEAENITVVNDWGTGEWTTSNWDTRSDKSSPQRIVPETTLENLAENADVVLQATDDIAIEDLSDNRLHFQSDNGWISLVADADEDGNGSVSTVDPGDAIATEGAAISISGAGVAARSVEAKGERATNSVEGMERGSWRGLETISDSQLLEVNQVLQIEQLRSRDFANHLNIDIDVEHLRDGSIRDSLFAIARQTSKRPAAIYVVARAESLELIVVTPYGSPIFKRVPTANRQALQQQVKSLIRGIANPPNSNNPESYRTAATQLYDWIIAPIESELQTRGIDMLLFSLDPGMRSLPLAALFDGNQFLVQKYSLSLIPSIYLTDTSYQNLKNSVVLAMGASNFLDPNVMSLPAVPRELLAITRNWPVQAFLNQHFTIDNLKSQRTSGQFSIIHLATHGQFDLEAPSKSYIQLWDDRLQFDRLRQLAATGKPVELLVLSACETAFGTAEAELGLAGLAVHSGVKSVLASLWKVEDTATLGLMSQFYRQLSQQSQTIKAEALRQAQIAMIEGDVWLEGNKVRSGDIEGEFFSQRSPSRSRDERSLSHPYYWASFVMIGSPW